MVARPAVNNGRDDTPPKRHARTRRPIPGGFCSAVTSQEDCTGNPPLLYRSKPYVRDLSGLDGPSLVWTSRLSAPCPRTRPEAEVYTLGAEEGQTLLGD